MEKNNNEVLENQNENELQNVTEDEATKVENEPRIEVNGKPINTKHKDKNKKVKNGSNISVEYRRPSFFYSILLILIGAMIATIVLLLVYIFKGADIPKVENPVVIEQGNNDENTPPEKDEKKLDLSIEGEFVKGLYEKIPCQMWGYDCYSGKTVKYEDITLNDKLTFVLRRMRAKNECDLLKPTDDLKAKMHCYADLIGDTLDIEKYEMAKIESNYKKEFGSDKSFEKIDIPDAAGWVYEYNTEDNVYYGHPKSAGGGIPYVEAKKIAKVEQSEDATEVYVYDNFLVCGGYYEGETYVEGIFTAAPTGELGNGEFDSKYLVTKITEPVDNTSLANYLEENKEGNIGKYKHTFKVDETGNYYWFSSEKI